MSIRAQTQTVAALGLIVGRVIQPPTTGSASEWTALEKEWRDGATVAWWKLKSSCGAVRWMPEADLQSWHVLPREDAQP